MVSRLSHAFDSRKQLYGKNPDLYLYEITEARKWRKPLRYNAAAVRYCGHTVEDSNEVGAVPMGALNNVYGI